jgi:hypothetical protein
MKATLVIAVVLSAVSILLVYGVGGEKPEAPSFAPQPSESQSGVCSGSVVETMNSGGYTYLKVDCGDRQVWAAGPQTQVAVGDNVSLAPGSEMRNFHSPTLNRTFETILFVTGIEASGDASAPDTGSTAEALQKGPGGGKQAAFDFSDIEKPAGAKTVAEIFSSRSELEGAQVLVLGKVVKFNAKIMGKNWIHLQDGTGEPASNDLTVTTDGTASVGDTVLIRGTVSLDKDLGAGYRYDILIEDATVKAQ